MPDVRPSAADGKDCGPTPARSEYLSMASLTRGTLLQGTVCGLSAPERSAERTSSDSGTRQTRFDSGLAISGSCGAMGGGRRDILEESAP